MNISSFFIDRPIFASVLSILVVVAGLVALPQLPVSEFPEVVPPTVVVSGRYPGAVGVAGGNSGAGFGQVTPTF